MAQILIANPAASNRWTTKTLAYVFNDVDDMHSFPEPLYTIIKTNETVEEVIARLQNIVGTNEVWVKNLSADGLTAKEKQDIEKGTKPDDVDKAYKKFTKIKTIKEQMNG